MKKSNLSSIFSWPFCRLELISTLIENRNQQAERPKQAIRSGRWKALCGAGIHILPIIFTIVLLFLNASTVYATSIGVGTANVNAGLNGLQFAAKIHEILIGASLSSMVLSLVQYIIFQAGVPIGSLFIAFRITDLTSLSSPEFWASLTADRSLDGRTSLGFLCLLTVFSTILAAVSGPASAILMLPSLDWWNFPFSEDSFLLDADFRLWFPNESSYPTGTFRAETNIIELWPNHIDGSYSHSSVCGFSNMLFTDKCPAGGHPVIQTWARTQRPSLVGDSWNITMPITLPYSIYDPMGASLTKTYSSRFIEGTGRHYNASDHSGSGYSEYMPDSNQSSLIDTWHERTWYMGQTSSVLATDALLTIAGIHTTSENETTRLQALVNNRSPPAPQAFAACSGFYYNVSNEKGGEYDSLASFQLPFLEKDTSNGQYWYAEHKQAFESWKSSGGWPLALWIAPPNRSANSPSIGVVTLQNFSNNLLEIETCSIYAGWRSSELFIDPKTDQYIHSPDLTNPTKDMDNWTSAINESRDYPMRNVQIDIDWANFALPPNYTILSIALSSTGSQAISLGLTVSSLIPDAMSRIRRSGEISIPLIAAEASGQKLDYEKYTYITVNRFRYGYSYSLQGITRWLALSILLLHIFLALVHTVMITCMGWTSKILKSLCEILVLAINSSPSAVLDNTCAGIERLDTYKQIVKVRETSFEHLGLVMNGDEDKHTKKVMIDKEYGSLGKKETFHCKED
ncbi:uncharacterized protein Bfra_010232 [Botrytis fragariae]|uniref:Uncharacterized protein n=1 Tax=Botrytis fragariae TaxID=1964551 RepID=A0A8H6AM31_9HELO|nr:uncharacterized protein Bfra_010232 [Botrytis fragariae]KAF5870086.1 hypothetical protein Bfra_010232 [Botrytis fragariae]